MILSAGEESIGAVETAVDRRVLFDKEALMPLAKLPPNSTENQPRQLTQVPKTAREMITKTGPQLVPKETGPQLVPESHEIDLVSAVARLLELVPDGLVCNRKQFCEKGLINHKQFCEKGLINHKQMAGCVWS